MQPRSLVEQPFGDGSAHLTVALKSKIHAIRRIIRLG
jgi:hypothetical protein